MAVTNLNHLTGHDPPRGDGRKVRPFSSQLRSRRGDHVVDRHVLAVRDTSTASPSPFVSAQCYPSSATSQPAMLMDDRCQLNSCSTFAIARRKRSWASEITNRTPFRPRFTSDRRNETQN